MTLRTLLITIVLPLLPGVAYCQTVDDTAADTTPATMNSSDFSFPEALSVSSDSLLNTYNAREYLSRSTDCNLPDTNIRYTPEVYQSRLRRLPTVVELPYNSIVQEYIDRYCGRLRQSVSIFLGAANFYMPIFEEALESYGLPLELKYLPVIESALNPRAVSKAGATGLWQFMITTGKQYGLEVNSLVDERCDPIKASYAAAHYLSDLYGMFHDWTLAIAAYNCGPDNVNKAIHRANDTDFWKIYPYLPEETRGYIPAFIAANYVMNYYCEHNICPMVATLPMKTDTLMLSRDVHFEQIAHVLQMDITAIEALNPQYRTQVINGGTTLSPLRLPTDAVLAFLDNEEDIYSYRADELLTKRAVTAVTEVPATTPARKTSSKNKRRTSSSKTVTVKKGDSLSVIAKRNGTTVNQLKRLNPSIKGSRINPGQKVRVK